MSGKFWDKAWSLVDQCTPVSEGCRNCWLKTLNKRTGKPWDGNVTFREDRLDIPLRTKKPTVFAIWSDLYHEAVTDEQIVMAYVAMAAASQHTFLIVTKRPERAAQWHGTFKLEDVYNEWYSVCATHGPCAEDWPLPNVYHIITVENQEMADERIPHALKIPGKVGLLIEPMLGPVDLSRWLFLEQSEITGEWIPEMLSSVAGKCSRMSVILGGETGPKARPMHPDWARSVRDQCEVAGVPFFFKSWGENWPSELLPDQADNTYWRTQPSGKAVWMADEYGKSRHELPDIRFMKFGKKSENRRLLDGWEHNELPWVTK